jgi:hypothetical protein
MVHQFPVFVALYVRSFPKNQVFVGQTSGVTFVGWKCQICVVD